jgi:hypothetical protein
MSESPAWIVIAALAALSACSAYASASEPVAVVGPFIMNQSEDGKASSDSFEVWDLLCNLKAPHPGEPPTCSLNAVFC